MLVLLVLLFSTAARAVEVEIEYGTVRGQTLELEDGTRINTFNGIPFGQAERFERPTKPEPWDETFIADTLGSVCHQPYLGVLFLTHPFWDDFSEDCLNVNIVAPEDTEGGPYPVMFYIYGGAFFGGANIQYPGHFLARKDVVVVIPNYRIGILGFASSGNENIRGNMGLWDQYLALQFTRDNIAAFGGDPDQITIFGQSAGAASTGMMLISPHTQGMFQSAILQSGSELALWAVNEPVQNPENMLVGVAEYVNCTTENQEDMIDCLKEVDPQVLSEAPVNCTRGYICLGFAPVVDGDYIPAEPIQLRINGSFANVPVMLGITSEDGSLYGPAVDPDMEWGYNRSQFEAFWRRGVDFFEHHIPSPERKEDIYHALLFNHAPHPYVDDSDKNQKELVDVCTDIGFSLTNDIHMKSQTEVAPVYHYVFRYLSSNASVIIPEWMGTFHIMEVPYVFGFPYFQHNDNVRNDTQIWFDPIDWNAEDVEWADYMIELWTNFAKTGNPTPEPVTPPGNPENTWPEFTNQDLNYHFIDRVMENRVDYRQKTFAFWQYYLRWMTFGEIMPYENSLQRAEEFLAGVMGEDACLGEYLKTMLVDALMNLGF